MLFFYWMLPFFTITFEILKFFEICVNRTFFNKFLTIADVEENAANAALNILKSATKMEYNFDLDVSRFGPKCGFRIIEFYRYL